MLSRVMAAVAAGTMLLAASANAQTQPCPYPVTLSNGTIADATEVMSDFSAVQNCVNWMSGGSASGSIVSGGTANAQTLTLAGLAAYQAGQRVLFKVGTGLTNTGAATLNVNGLGTKSILSRSGTAMAPGEIAAGQWIEVVYDGTNFVLLSLPTKAVAKAWARFNGTNGVIADSFNISGVTRTSTGRYTVTFANAMANANYAIVLTTEPAEDSTQRAAAGPFAITTSSFAIDVATRYTQVDPAVISVLIFHGP